MRIFRITVKDYDYDCYTGFVVASPSIPDALECIYKLTAVKDEETGKPYAIPYYMRSSNLNIENLGEFISELKTPYIIFTGYNNA